MQKVDMRNMKENMNKKTTKDAQHIIPRIYLKYFRIAKDKNFVYCIDFSNKYKTGVQTLGLNDKVFKQRRYYNIPFIQNPYIIEDVLGEDLEPQYDRIMEEVSKELPLSVDTIEKIMQWLYISQMRSPYIRDNIGKIINFSLKTTERYKHKNLSIDKEKQIEEYSKKASKEIHLSNFANEKQVKDLITLNNNTLNSKHWLILKSSESFPFWTNDNPGFSPNLHPIFAKNKPFHQVMELNDQSIIYYVLSPKYCLKISPFNQGTPLDICALKMKIEFEDASPTLIDYVNKGVFYSRIKLLISNKKELLEKCVIRDLNARKPNKS